MRDAQHLLVVLCRAVAERHLADQARADEQLQRAVDRGARDPGILAAGPGHEVVGLEVTMLLEHHVDDGTALGGVAQPATGEEAAEVIVGGFEEGFAAHGAFGHGGYLNGRTGARKEQGRRPPQDAGPKKKFPA